MIFLLITTLMASGLCSLSSYVPRQFHVVKEQKTWTEAQQYCRQEFTDLATIEDMTENEKVKSLIHDSGVNLAWIGLKQGSRLKWQWSLADRDFYSKNETQFLNWAQNQPDDGEEYCGLQDGEKWHDYFCNGTLSFICYNGGHPTKPYELVKTLSNWTNAQRYCRETYTDLASVRNQTENDQIHSLIGSGPAWIGLFRDAWEWSDGSITSFRLWESGAPGHEGVKTCSQVHTNGQWTRQECTDPAQFICYEAPKMVKKQMVKVKLQVDSQVNISDPAVQEVLLLEIQQRLRDRGCQQMPNWPGVSNQMGRSSKRRRRKSEE